MNREVKNHPNGGVDSAARLVEQPEATPRCPKCSPALWRGAAGAQGRPGAGEQRRPGRSLAAP